MYASTVNERLVDMPNARELRSTIAANLKQERNRLGWSLSEVARRSGMSKSSLSQLEAGEANPSLETLWGVANALGVPFSHLVTTPHQSTKFVRRGTAPAIRGGSDDYVASLLAPAATGTRRDIYWIESPRDGQEHHSEPHAAGTVEHLIVASGSALAGPTKAPVTVTPGDYFQYPGDEPHVFTALEPGTSGVLILEQP